jgi:hypothetical protein
MPFERFLEHLRRALEIGRDRSRQIRFAFDLLDGVDRVAEGEARRKVEGDRDRRLLALVVDLQRPHGAHDPGHRRQRHHRSGQGADAADAAAGRVARRALAGDTGATGLIDVGLEENLRKPRRIGLDLRQALQDHLVVVGRREDRRHLARAERIEQFLTDLIDRDAVDAGRLAIDLDRHLRIAKIEIAGDIAQTIDLGDLLGHFGRGLVKRIHVARLHRVEIFAL